MTHKHTSGVFPLFGTQSFSVLHERPRGWQIGGSPHYALWVRRRRYHTLPAHGSVSAAVESLQALPYMPRLPMTGCGRYEIGFRELCGMQPARSEGGLYRSVLDYLPSSPHLRGSTATAARLEYHWKALAWSSGKRRAASCRFEFGQFDLTEKRFFIARQYEDERNVQKRTSSNCASHPAAIASWSSVASTLNKTPTPGLCPQPFVSASGSRGKVTIYPPSHSMGLCGYNICEPSNL